MLKKYFSSSLFIAILFFVVGAILFTNPNGVVKFITYLIGGAFLLAGVYKLFTYFRNKKKMNAQMTDFIYGVVAVVVGIVLILCTSAIETVIRFVIGAWVLYTGITKLVFAFQLQEKKVSAFKVTLIVGILMIVFGLYIILRKNLVFSGIGLCIMIYSVLEITQYIFCAKSAVKTKEIQ